MRGQFHSDELLSPKLNPHKDVRRMYYSDFGLALLSNGVVLSSTLAKDIAVGPLAVGP